MTEEKTIWRGSSSPILYAGYFLFCGLGVLICLALALILGIKQGLPFALAAVAASLIPLGLGAWRWILNQSRVFEITSQRIRVTSGLFSKTSQEMELYRIKDITLVEPFLQRLGKCGNLILATNDASTPTLAIEAVPNVELLREDLRNAVEVCRDQKRVRLNELE
jgi:uncharacterized membrane protein YdbT with pleckstrin-like domain